MQRGRTTAAAAALLLSLAAPQPVWSDNTSESIAGSVAVALGVSIVCASLAIAVDEPADLDERLRKGWLAMFGGTYGAPTFQASLEEDLNGRTPGPPLTATLDGDFGVNGGVGYRCHRYLSAEAEVEWVRGFRSDVSTLGVEVANLDVKPITVTSNVKAYPLTDWLQPWLQPFLLVGAGVVTGEVETRDSLGLGLSDSQGLTEFAVRVGGGVDLYATKHWVVDLGVDYVLPFSSQLDLDYISIGFGIQYRF